jgi:hypothetical protein
VLQVHEWVDDYGGRIWNQQKRMGISVDWDRQVFTLDASMSRAVLEAFVRFHEVRSFPLSCFLCLARLLLVLSNGLCVWHICV